MEEEIYVLNQALPDPKLECKSELWDRTGT